MKNIIFSLIILSGLLTVSYSCKNSSVKENPVKETDNSLVSANLILIGKDIITEVIVRPDTLGDPWEVEKVKSYDGNAMFTRLFENIYNKKVTVYDILTDEPLTPGDVRKLEDKFGSDLSKISKIQFREDWYFDPAANKIIKKMKSASFGYQNPGEEGSRTKYNALFKLNIVQ